jgi:hypothetical protein
LGRDFEFAFDALGEYPGHCMPRDLSRAVKPTFPLARRVPRISLCAWENGQLRCRREDDVRRWDYCVSRNGMPEDIRV